MKYKSILTIAVVFAILSIAMAGTASAKSLYVIADINAGGNIPVEAYNINPSGTLSYQTTQYVANIGGGAVGIAIDTDSEMLFVTSEFSDVLQKIDAVTFASQGTQVAAGASDLAGIVVDQDKGRVYTVDRGTSDLYIYDVATFTPVATVTLTNANAWGIALDETADLLYVACATNTIRYYDTATWTEQGTISVTPTVIGVAVDATNGYVYSGGWSSNQLSKYDGVTETTITCSGGNPIGFAVDPATSNLYVTTTVGDELMAYDSNLNELQSISFNGDPTGLCIPGKGDTGVNKLNLAKTDGVTTVLQGGQLTYTITFDNVANTDPVTGVTLVDDLPAEVSFVSATGPGAAYDSVTHTVSWTIADLPAGASTQTVTVTVTVDPMTPVGTILDNAVTINGIEQGAGPTTKHDDNTEVVGPTTNAFVVSSDSAGTEKNVFNLADNVYCYAGNLPASDPAVNIHLVANKVWSVGDTITADVSSSVETVSTDASGNIGVTQIWTGPLVAGKYDIVVDVDQNGVLDAGEPVDGITMEGLEAIPEFPTVAIPVAAILGLMFLLQRRKD